MPIEVIKLELGKMLAALVPAGYFIWTGEMQIAIITFALFITLDTITGAIKSTALFNGGFSSTKLVNMKKVICYMLAIIFAYLLSLLPYFDGAFVYVVTWFSLREAWSVMENLSEMGLQFPQDIVKKVAGQVKKEDENNNK